MARKRIKEKLKRLRSSRAWRPAGVAAAAVALYLAALAGVVRVSRRAQSIELAAEKGGYLHYELVRVELRAKEPFARRLLRAQPPEAWVTAGGRPLATIGGIIRLKLSEEKDGLWTAEWPIPWNAPEGVYGLQARLPEALASRVEAGTFKVGRRAPKPLQPGFVALTLEDLRPYGGLKITGPDGTRRDWRAIFDWAEYTGADAVWVLGGETPGPNGQLWVDYNLPLLPALAKEAHRRGLKFGVWAMCYLAMPGAPHHPRYEYAVEVKDGRLEPTRSISLRDPNRPGDIIAMLKRFRDIPEVDYLGLDYIRNAKGGFELAEDFYREMPGVTPPPGWDKLSREEKIVAFSQLGIHGRDRKLSEAWRWWRAHRVAGVVARVRKELGDSKMIWAFTLGWQKGWEHGQDPVMMTDAGVDIDAVMLYEADREQFANMMHDWPAYVRSGQAQVIAGEVLDNPLHQGGGPDEYRRRAREAAQKMYADARVPGMFIHDLSRGLWGRLKPYGSRQWLEAARQAVLEFRGAWRLASRDRSGREPRP